MYAIIDYVQNRDELSHGNLQKLRPRLHGADSFDDA